MSIVAQAKAIISKQEWEANLAEWHKDSHPLTKNADGSPKVFYRGDRADMKQFHISNDDYAMFGGGIYLTPDKSLADGFARNGGQAYEVYVNIKNPIKISGKDWITFLNKSNAEQKRDFLLHKGYDGIIDIKGKYKQLLAVNPSQIKSIHNKGTFDENSNVITDSINNDILSEFITKSLSHNIKDDESYTFGTIPTKTLSLIEKFTGIKLRGYSVVIYPSYVRHLKNRHPNELPLLHKIQVLLETSVYADKEVIKNKSTGKAEVFYRIFSKQTKSYIKMVKKMDYHKKELSITTLHILDEEDPNLPLPLRLSLDAIQPQTLRHNPNSDGNHQVDDNGIIPQNIENVKFDSSENILDEIKKHFLELYKKEFNLIPKITKGKDFVYIYMFEDDNSRTIGEVTKKAVVAMSRYSVSVKDWEYVIKHNQKDFYDREYVRETDDYIYHMTKSKVNQDSLTITQKAKAIIDARTVNMDMAVPHTASFEAKLSDLRAEVSKIVKDKNKLKADEKELYEFIMSNKQYVTFIKDNIRNILTKGDDKKGFKHIVIRHYRSGADSEIDVWDIIRIGKTIINGTALTTAEVERYKEKLGKSRQAKRRLSKTPNGDYMFFVGIGREINGDNIVITYYKNRLGGGATDVKPKSADVKQDTIGNGDPHVPNDSIITKNTQNVNQDAIFSYEELSSLTYIEPTEAQKIAGNYQKPKITLYGLTISIENTAGSTRSGVDENGDKWEVVMQDHYGYINGTKAIDGDHLDIFVNAATKRERLQELPIYVIEQVNPKTGIFDEFKLIAGAISKEHAKEIYLRNYSKDWGGFGSIGMLENYSNSVYFSILTDSIKSNETEAITTEQDNTQGEQMSLQEQIIAEKSITKKALLIIEAQKQHKDIDKKSKNKIMCLITDQREIEDFPPDAIPSFVATLEINSKEYNSILCRDREEAERMCEEMVREYKINKAWQGILV